MERISQQTIDEIMNVADIVEVIGEYVQLQPAGKSYKGLCPFHNEKHLLFSLIKKNTYLTASVAVKKATLRAS